MTRDPHCGRLDPHPPHEWLGRNHDAAHPTIVRECPGAPVVEGGNPIHHREATPGFAQRVAEEREHFPWHYTEIGVQCSCGRPCTSGEDCAVMVRAHRWEAASDIRRSTAEEIAGDDAYEARYGRGN